MHSQKGDTLKRNFGLGREDCQQAVTDEFLCIVAGCALGTDVCHWMFETSQHGSRSRSFPFKRKIWGWDWKICKKTTTELYLNASSNIHQFYWRHHRAKLLKIPQEPWEELQITLTGQKKPLSTMLATSKNVLFPGHSHLLTTDADDLTLWLLSARVIIKVKSHQHRWLAGGYDLEIGHF